MNESSDWQVPGNWAEIYENVFVSAMIGEWALKGLTLANLQPGERVLDVACGTGALTRLVPKSIGLTGRVVGLDSSPEALAVARQITLYPSSAVPIEWCEGDANSIPFENETFDVVFCEFGIMFFPDRAAALKEMRRVLMPNGRLVVSVWGLMSKCPGLVAIKEGWERHFGNPHFGELQFSLSDPETVLALLRDAGFRDAAVQTAMGVVRLSSPEHLVRSYGAMGGIQTDEKNRTLVINEVSAALQSYIGEQGLVFPIEAILASARK